MASPAENPKTDSAAPVVAPATEPVAPATQPEVAPSPAPEPAPVEKKDETVAEEKKAEAPAEVSSAPAGPSAPTEELEKLNIEEKKVEAEPTPDAVTPSAGAAPPADETKAEEKTVAPGGPVWPEISAGQPLALFFESIGELTKEAGHNEVWQINLSPSNEFLTKLILQKFLRANQNDLNKAKEQLVETLKWRKQFDPVKAAADSYDKDTFDGLGYILELENVPGSTNKKDVVTFNIYGAVKDNKKTFGNLDGFLRWRVGLMERSVQKLNLAAATQPIPDFGQGPDPYQGFQVHDYLQVSFIRQDPHVKASSKKTIEVLGRFYPETLSRKFFVNVPILMGWVFQAMKLFVSKETVKKFSVLSYGNQLAAELGKGVPTVYGGEAGDLKEIAIGMNLTETPQDPVPSNDSISPPSST
ncbi:CRAL/TRIO domain-containing protein [Corynespora cassiicola Philippines]|uniref:Phosphatidylinositol transfer protein SFH5 n=1 Tax=Corynespora cassiicola Philippines TaxID=1448308 RepID=A0A2T2NNI0_CORCC|nr:CRAL/TRIO domain-containing protein [Corynespora cassiicola Philippines]